MTKSLALLLLAGSAVPAMAQTAPQHAKPKEDKVCRREVATGSIMAKRTCHTHAEWAAIDGQNASNTETFRQRPAQNSGLSTY